MEKKMDIEDFNRELLAKYISNEVNDREKSEVETWLSQSAENLEELEQSLKMLAHVDTFYQAKRFQSGSAWNKVQSKIEMPQIINRRPFKTRKVVLLQFYKYAAVIVFALLLGSAGYYIGFRNRVVYSEVITAENQVVNEYVLPDGSVVALNGNSKLVFPKQFTGDFREVTVEGEAFFDVSHNPEIPFVIHAGNAQVKVLGTSFNVNAYPESGTVEVVVATGKVMVSNTNPDLLVAENREILLVPGEKGTLFSTKNQLEKMLNPDPNYLAWKTHDLIFNEVPLGKVIACLEKIYHVEIQVNEPKINDFLLKAHFNKKSIGFVLDVVRLTFNLELSVENEQYILSGRKESTAKL